MTKKYSNSRRKFLQSTAIASIALAATGNSVASVTATLAESDSRKLRFFNTHTKESLEVVYCCDGQYDEKVLTELNLLMRDHRENEAVVMDPQLFDQLWTLQQNIGGDGVFEIISGYRSPNTNGSLRKTSTGVAEKSFHTKGRAIDVRLRGTKLRKLQKAALKLKAGGVGYYPTSDFIHLDTGPVRSWS